MSEKNADLHIELIILCASKHAYRREADAFLADNSPPLPKRIFRRVCRRLRCFELYPDGVMPAFKRTLAIALLTSLSCLFALFAYSGFRLITVLGEYSETGMSNIPGVAATEVRGTLSEIREPHLPEKAVKRELMKSPVLYNAVYAYENTELYYTVRTSVPGEGFDRASESFHNGSVTVLVADSIGSITAYESASGEKYILLEWSDGQCFYTVSGNITVTEAIGYAESIYEKRGIG